MRAEAALATRCVAGRDGRVRTRISTLRSEPPITLRPTIPNRQDPRFVGDAPSARVCVAAAAAGPIGGDRFALRVDVGERSTLVLREVSATLVLPGARGEQSRLTVDVSVGAGATLVWLTEPVIAARDCHHVGEIRVALASDARLLLREELLLGRFAEEPGAVRQSLRVTLDGRPLLHQEMAVGGDAPAWASPAVTGGHLAIGSLLVVDPSWGENPPAATPLAGDAALLPLEGPAVLVSALCPDALTLRRTLETALDLLERPEDDPSTEMRAHETFASPQPSPA
jgi:urease accessory protein